MNEQREWFDKSFSFGLVPQLMIKHVDEKKAKMNQKALFRSYPQTFFFPDFQ